MAPDVGGGVGVVGGVGVEEPLPPPPQPIPAARTARQTKPSIDRHLRRREGRPSRNTPAKAAPPLAASHSIRRAEGPGDLTELAGMDALMVSVAVVFPFTVTEVGFRAQLIPVGAVHARATAALKPLMEPRFSVAVPVEPAATVTFGFCASIEKSDRGFESDKPN